MDTMRDATVTIQVYRFSFVRTIISFSPRFFSRNVFKTTNPEPVISPSSRSNFFPFQITPIASPAIVNVYLSPVSLRSRSKGATVSVVMFSSIMSFVKEREGFKRLVTVSTASLRSPTGRFFTEIIPLSNNARSRYCNPSPLTEIVTSERSNATSSSGKYQSESPPVKSVS